MFDNLFYSVLEKTKHSQKDRIPSARLPSTLIQHQCKNCGASLNDLNTSIIVCEYCKSRYENNKITDKFYSAHVGTDAGRLSGLCQKDLSATEFALSGNYYDPKQMLENYWFPKNNE
jgi:uncharacterized Zn finger protein (UPF0148 family)